MAGFTVDPESLREAGRDIRAAVAPATDIDLPGSVGQREWYGHSGLATATGEFAMTWQVGIAALIRRAYAFEEQLEATARRYEQSDGSGVQALAQTGRLLPG